MMTLIGNGKGADVYEHSRKLIIKVEVIKIPYESQQWDNTLRRDGIPWGGFTPVTRYKTKENLHVSGGRHIGSVSAYKLRSLLGVSLTTGTPLKVSQRGCKSILEAL